MGRHPPSVVERIMEPSYAVAPGLFGGLEDCLGACAEGITKDGVYVFDIGEVHARPCGVVDGGFTQHHYGVADAHIRVFNRPVRLDLALPLFHSTEDIAQEGNEMFDSLDDDVGVDAVETVPHA